MKTIKENELLFFQELETKYFNKAKQRQSAGHSENLNLSEASIKEQSEASNAPEAESRKLRVSQSQSDSSPLEEIKSFTQESQAY